LKKNGGFLPLLALLPLIFGGISAAGAAAGGTSAIVNAVKTARAQNAAQAETDRPNRAIESELQSSTKAGSGILSDLAGKITVFGATLKYGLQKLGLSLDDCNRIKNGECICMGKGLFFKREGNGLYLGPQGRGLF